MNVLIDGFTTFFKYEKEIVLFFIVLLGLGLFTTKNTVTKELNLNVRILASFSIGCVVLCVITYVLIVLSHFLPPLLRPASYIILFFSIFSFVRELKIKEIKFLYDARILFGVLFLFVLLIIRLAFLKEIILPPYSDSPIHFQIISDLLHAENASNFNLSLKNIFTNYYHFGFHSLVVWLTSVTNLDPLNAIPLLGQLFLVIGPVSILFSVYVLTNDGIGALFAGLLAALGWHMPAFAANWGKYPAIVALATTPAVIAYIKLTAKRTGNKKSDLFLGVILLIGVALLHTRIIAVFFLLLVCLFLLNKLNIAQELSLFQSIGFSFLFVISLWPLKLLLNDFYNGIFVFAVLLMLLPFAFKVFPKLSIGVFLFTSGTWLLVIAPSVLYSRFPALLDKQFLEMMLYIPFSIMGGAGISGLINQEFLSEKLRRLIVGLLFITVLINFSQNNTIYPDACCDYFSKSDQEAFDWIQERNTQKTLVVISTHKNNTGQIIGTDAGIWLFPLLGQPTNKLPFDFDWNLSNEVEELCHFGADELLIYVGNKPYSFDDTHFSNGGWTKPVFVSGKNKIYQVIGCNQ